MKSKIIDIFKNHEKVANPSKPFYAPYVINTTSVSLSIDTILSIPDSKVFCINEALRTQYGHNDEIGVLSDYVTVGDTGIELLKPLPMIKRIIILDANYLKEEIIKTLLSVYSFMYLIGDSYAEISVPSIYFRRPDIVLEAPDNNDKRKLALKHFIKKVATGKLELLPKQTNNFKIVNIGLVNGIPQNEVPNILNEIDEHQYTVANNITTRYELNMWYRFYKLQAKTSNLVMSDKLVSNTDVTVLNKDIESIVVPALTVFVVNEIISDNPKDPFIYVNVSYKHNGKEHHGELRVNRLFLNMQYNLDYNKSISIVGVYDGYPLYYAHVTSSHVIINKPVKSICVLLEAPNTPGNMTKFLYSSIRNTVDFISVYY